MTNKEIIEKYLNKENARNNNLMSFDYKLSSYNLKISEIKDNKIIVFDYDINTIKELTGYKSLTTRKHIALLKEALNNNSKKVIIDKIYSYSKK